MIILRYLGFLLGRMRWVALGGLTLLFLLFTAFNLPTPSHAENERVITVYHDGTEETLVTDATTVDEALSRAGVALSERDTVEPTRDTVLTAPSYSVNVYRARPVTVVDGPNRYELISAHTSARQIAADAGLTLQPEDEYEVTRIDDFLGDDGIGLKLTIDRATPITLVLYGKTQQIYTQASTVGDFMKEKNITLAEQDGASLAADVAIAADLQLRIWRDGVSTVTQEESVPFTTQQISDSDKPAYYQAVQTPGVLGKKLVTYQIELRDGQEVSRTVIQSVVTAQPSTQIEVVGTKPSAGALSQSKGVNFYVDSRGVRHRETYYDLPMNGTMKFCNGTYSVRSDGVKIDQDGYILVAAKLDLYPRCSIVETSLGKGRVYDTGGFALVHPHGFDIATDWSNKDGR